jgi:hypothetical protein
VPYISAALIFFYEKFIVEIKIYGLLLFTLLCIYILVAIAKVEWKEMNYTIGWESLASCFGDYEHHKAFESGTDQFV